MSRAISCSIPARSMKLRSMRLGRATGLSPRVLRRSTALRSRSWLARATMPQTQYTILTANGAGGVGGTFSGVTSNLAFLDPSLSYDVHNVYLTMTRNSVAFNSVGMTPNQIATGGGVESLGSGSPVYNAV